ncbi:uncharacterized protein LOC120198519 [Hibiscus syriacus]|uniref:uncharacterized protein LOC120198519 n=1 Tax=Hibiscus syriacus TaxID=106335 RepID=UPI0019218940|nr:uncharacterized protein LOC120198519 [Hibiscus syriacus]
MILFWRKTGCKFREPRAGRYAVEEGRSFCMYQDDDCCHIDEGERVLVNRKLQSKNLFHDAAVEKVERIRHLRRSCRCTFMIKWLDNDLEGQTLTVPSSSIMKLATKSISDYPVVHILLKPEKDADLSYSSPLLTTPDENDANIELNKLLQKQIEQISNLADAPEKDFPDDFLWRNKVPSKGQTPCRPTVKSNACIPSLKRMTRGKTELQVDIETKDQFGTMASIQEEFIQNRSHPLPLSLSAALASSLLSAKKRLEMDFNSCMTADMFMKGKHSTEILAISILLVSDASQAISPVFPTKGDASCKPSSCVPTKVWGNENKTSEKINCDAEDRISAPVKVTAEIVTSEVAMTTDLAIAKNKKSSVLKDFNASSTAPMRLTRSAMRKGAVFPNECTEAEICTDNKKRRISGNKNKLSHSTVHQENENLANEEENNATPFTGSGSSERNIVIPERNVSGTESTKDKRCLYTMPGWTGW